MPLRLYPSTPLRLKIKPVKNNAITNTEISKPTNPIPFSSLTNILQPKEKKNLIIWNRFLFVFLPVNTCNLANLFTSLKTDLHKDMNWDYGNVPLRHLLNGKTLFIQIAKRFDSLNVPIPPANDHWITNYWIFCE